MILLQNISLYQKKTSIKKIIEQNELIENMDYDVNYNFSKIALKQCICTYKLKFCKLFFTMEESFFYSIKNNTIELPQKIENNMIEDMFNEIKSIIKCNMSMSTVLNKLDSYSNDMSAYNAILNKLDSNTTELLSNSITTLNKIDSYSNDMLTHNNAILNKLNSNIAELSTHNNAILNKLDSISMNNSPNISDEIHKMSEMLLILSKKINIM